MADETCEVARQFTPEWMARVRHNDVILSMCHTVLGEVACGAPAPWWFDHTFLCDAHASAWLAGCDLEQVVDLVITSTDRGVSSPA